LKKASGKKVVSYHFMCIINVRAVLKFRAFFVF
jgi:hypothetical protein